MPPIPKKIKEKIKNRCVACNGTGESSRRGMCYPCSGTGKRQENR